MANVLISIVANSHCNTGGKFEDRPLFKLMSSTLITLEIPLLKSVGQLFVDAAEGISTVINVDDINLNNGLSSNLLPVLPCELAKNRYENVCQISSKSSFALGNPFQ